VGTGEALGGPEPAGFGKQRLPITGNHREVAGGHQGVGGGRSTAGWCGTTQPGRREGPLLHRRIVLEEGSVSARLRARSTARADGLDKVRALQRVLYRSAKQQPDRRFHALFDKVARSDVLERAWDDVRANRGAPGVDGVTIEQVEASGVAAFLQDLAAALRAGTYRPAPLRRVDIPKPGQPGKTRPLGIPTVRDRVAMTAAKLVLEPVFEADFLPSSYGFRPKRSAIRRVTPCGSRLTVAANGCWTPTSVTASAPSITRL
jgi:hypothetical protein